MIEMIPFYLIFPKCRWLLGALPLSRPPTPISIYVLSETINYVYIIFSANKIISSATRHQSYISLNDNIWGILKDDI